MGYDIHITRRKDWCDEDDDISLEEFVAYLRGDREFTYPGQLGEYSGDWHSPKTVYESSLCWSDGHAFTKNPEPEFIDKLVKVAAALQAKVQGDDGEVYLSATEIQKTHLEPTTHKPQPTPVIHAFFLWPKWKQCLVAFVFGCVLLALRLLIFGR